MALPTPHAFNSVPDYIQHYIGNDNGKNHANINVLANPPDSMLPGDTINQIMADIIAIYARLADNSLPISVLARSTNAGAPLLGGGSGAASGYGPLNLAGGSNVVTGTLPVGNLPLLNGVKLQDVGETVNPLGNATGSTAIDCTLGNIVTATSTGTTTWSITNPWATGTGCTVELRLTNGGAHTQNWPSGTDWGSAGAPTLQTSGLNIITFQTIDGGSTWQAVLSF